MKLIFKVAISIAMVVIALWIADPSDLAGAWQDVQWPMIGLVVALYLLNLCTKAFRWSVILRSTGLRVPFWTVLRSFTMGLAIDNVTPGGVAGEAARVYHLSRTEGLQIGSGVATVAAESTMDLLAVTSIGILGMLILMPSLLASEVVAMWMVLGAGLVISAFIIYALARPNLIERMTVWLSIRVRRTFKGRTGVRLSEQLLAFGTSFKGSLMLKDAGRRRAMWKASGLTAVIWSNECLRFALILWALGTDVDMASAMVVVSLTWLIANILVAGLSNMVTATSVLAVTGVDLGTAKTAGILSAMTSIWISIPLGIIAIVLLERKTRVGQGPWT